MGIFFVQTFKKDALIKSLKTLMLLLNKAFLKNILLCKLFLVSNPGISVEYFGQLLGSKKGLYYLLHIASRTDFSIIFFGIIVVNNYLI
jgi:hypothetical protein